MRMDELARKVAERAIPRVQGLPRSAVARGTKPGQDPARVRGIDAIGEQGHAFSTTGPVDAMRVNLDALADEVAKRIGAIYDIEPLRAALAQVRDEAMEAVANVQEKRSTERHGWDKYGDAAAIRAMKEKP